MQTRSSLTRDWVSVRVWSKPVGAQPAVVLDAQPASIAIVPAGEPPVAGDWHEAEWVGAAGNNRTMRIMVGPGATPDPGAGIFTVWCQVDGGTWRITEPAYKLAISDTDT